jgi:hypothetical protein
MKRMLGLGVVMGALVACLPTPVVEEGGANANDRTHGGEMGEPLLTGVMEITPSGKYAVMQRNTVTVVLDVEGKTSIELPNQIARVALSRARDVAYALYADGSLVALDLADPTKELWRASSTFLDVSLFKVSDDDTSLLIVDKTVASTLDPGTGKSRGTADLHDSASFGSFLPKAGKAIVVGHTTFTDHKPSTPVSLLDLATATMTQITIPNCEAPVVVLPDESRAMVSPTFCEEAKSSNPDDTWTNPDPVSIIDVTGEGLSFLKNLPGFGPVALSPDGSRAVAYLDVARVDATMFDDKSQVPGAGAAQYHLLVIDPKTLEFSVDPIGDALPRFAMTEDGKGLLIDASIKVTHRAQAKADAKISLGPDGISGEVNASLSVFDENSPFGYFDLATGKFSGFAGVQAGLDRFVQLADGQTVITLQKRTDGLGGMPFRIDVAGKATAALTGDYGTGVRDIGLLPDGKTILLRLRQPAAQIGNQLFSRESYCYSLDGVTCGAGRVEYQATVSFASVETNDCGAMGHDCW